MVSSIVEWRVSDEMNVCHYFNSYAIAFAVEPIWPTRDVEFKDRNVLGAC
jgi:hypothetical protein